MVTLHTPAPVQGDSNLVKDQLQALQAMYKAWGPDAFISYMVWIRSKGDATEASAELNAKLVPFQPNKIQRTLSLAMGRNNIVLKARQQGLTTFLSIFRLLIPAILEPGSTNLLISQNKFYVTKHFEIITRAHNYFGVLDPNDTAKNTLANALRENLLATTYSNRSEIRYKNLDSTLIVESAEVEEAGQGVTLTHALCSEYSRWPGMPESTLSNVLGAIVPQGTVDIEATANGAYGSFYKEWNLATNGQSAYKPHFFPWWDSDEYQDDLTPEQAIALALDMKEDERKLKEAALLSLNQIAWRRRTIIAQKADFFEKYPETAQSAFLTSGKSYFDAELIRLRQIQLTNYTPKQLIGEQVEIYSPAIPGREYIIGADVALGRKIGDTDSDYSAASVIDKITGEQMARYRNRLSPAEYGLDLAYLGRLYNDALIGVERNMESGAVLITLANDAKYTNVYQHKEWYKTANALVEIPGIPTNTSTRPLMLNFLNRYVSANIDKIWDKTFLKEAVSFIRAENGAPSAAPGEHDDVVMCNAIAQGVRMASLGWWVPWDQKREKYKAANQGEDIPQG